MKLVIHVACLDEVTEARVVVRPLRTPRQNLGVCHRSGRLVVDWIRLFL